MRSKITNYRSHTLAVFFLAQSALSQPYKEPYSTYSSVFKFTEATGLEEANETVSIFRPDGDPKVLYVDPSGKVQNSLPGAFAYQSSSAFDYAHIEDNEAKGTRERTPLFGELQSSALKRMLANGYISTKEYQELSHVEGFQQSQILVSRIYSELTFKEAEGLFGKGKIPWERVFAASSKFKDKDSSPTKDSDDIHFKMLQQHFESSQEKLKIIRSSIVVFLGQSWNAKQEKFIPISLPLQSNSEFSQLMQWDRNKFPMIAQIGRALSEGEPLKGVFHHALQALMPYLRAEAAQAGIPTDQYLVFNTADDDAHARLYSSALNLRVLSAELKDQMAAANIEEVAKVINKSPTPQGLRSNNKQKFLMVGTAGIGEQLLKPSDFSWMARKVSTGLTSGYSENTASQVYRDFYRNITHFLNVKMPGAEMEQDAALVINLDHSMLASLGIANLMKLGKWKEGRLQEIGNHLMSADIPTGFFSPQDPKLLIPIDLIKEHHPAIILQRFDSKMFKKFGNLYLASLIFAVQQEWEDSVKKLPEQMPEYSFQVAEGWLDFRPQPTVDEDSKQSKKTNNVKILNQSQARLNKPRIYFLSDDPEISRALQELGGTRKSAVSAEVLGKELKVELERSLESALKNAMATFSQVGNGSGNNNQEAFQRHVNRVMQETLNGFSNGSVSGMMSAIVGKIQVNSKASSFEFSPEALENMASQFPYLKAQPPVSLKGHQVCEEFLRAVLP